MEMLVLAIGGFCGAAARYLASRLWFRNQKYPISFTIIAINGAGSLCLGLLQPISFYLGPLLRIFLTTGFLGAFTTLSTFSMEAVELTRRKDYSGACLYILLSIGGSIVLYYTGYSLSSRLSQ